MVELILKEEVYQVIGAAMDVYYQLGPRIPGACLPGGV